MKTLNEFKAFILRGNVVDLAIGIVIGVAFTAVVTAFVTGIITPLIGMFGKFNFSGLTVTINHSTFLIGSFVNAVISFLIIALVLFFFVVKPVNALMNLHKTEATPAAPATQECPYCLSSIPARATRCAFCTSEIPAAEVAPA